MKMNEKSIETLKQLLRGSICSVRFTKTNGQERIMKCTLREDIVPARVEERKVTYTPNPDVCPVYDVDAEGWRSFRYDSIISIEFGVMD